MSTTVPRLIVGLGNPKDSYHNTRHNVGKRFVEFLAKGAPLTHQSRTAEAYSLSIGGSVPVTGCLLTCYMNESGPCLKKFIDAEGFSAADLLVVIDDFMIPFGSLRLRSEGSAGGHNGLKSILETLGLEDIGRLRVGIGPVPPGEDPADFVLKPFKSSERDSLSDIFKIMEEGLRSVFAHGYSKAMNVINKQHLLT
jgi:PTH1 family peptidyl-tRNA hydrolase